ncbi:hypothetical protein GCM10007984_23800 [Shewanella putrefaciens]|nr:hypothetical protein GCM10007984_23800 [Shewanella putrefaciens]
MRAIKTVIEAIMVVTLGNDTASLNKFLSIPKAQIVSATTLIRSKLIYKIPVNLLRTDSVLQTI